MAIENNWINQDSENKNNKLLDDEKIKEEEKKHLEFIATKEKINVEIETEEKIWNLKELLEYWVISSETADKIISGINISNEEIAKIFEKINEIEDVKDVDKYLPKELRITHEQYVKALSDDIYRVQTITKLNSALTLLANQINPDSFTWLNLFSGFITILDKNLIKIQENTIDIKNELIEIDEKKFWKKLDTRSFLQKIIDFIKELFN